MRIFFPSDNVALLLDIVGWGLVHVVTGYAVHRLPLQSLRFDGRLLQARRFERGGRLYERLHIRSWKDRLPEAGAVFAGGMSKRRLTSGRAGLERFAMETRRAELGHWWAMTATPLFVLWNPANAAALLVAYGVAANLPFILIQRYNRQRVARVLAGRAARGLD